MSSDNPQETLQMLGRKIGHWCSWLKKKFSFKLFSLKKFMLPMKKLLYTLSKRSICCTSEVYILPTRRILILPTGCTLFFSSTKRIVPFRPSLKDLNAPLIHLIDAKGSISNDISSSEILNKYDAQKYELLQVGIRDSVPIIKVFPKVTPKDPLQSSREPSPHRQKPREEKEKTIEMNSTIGGNDFEHKMHMLNCFLAKVIRVKVLLTLRGTSSALDLENLFAKIKARIDASGVGEVVAPVQQAAKKVQFVVRPKLTPEYP